MPNFSTGWSASSLTPAARAVVNNANMASPAASPTVQNLLNNAAQANPYGTTQVSGATNNLLAAIYGPNYQSLLQSKTAGDGDNGVDSEFQKWMTNFLYEKTLALKNSRDMSGAAVWNPDEARKGAINTPFGPTDAERRQTEDYSRRQRSIQQALPYAASVAKMAAYTPTFGGSNTGTQQPNISGWTPAGMAWMPQQQPSAATQAGMQLTGMQRPNYAQSIMNSQSQREDLTRIPGRNVGGGNIGVANTWQSRLMAQGAM